MSKHKPHTPAEGALRGPAANDPGLSRAALAAVMLGEVALSETILPAHLDAAGILCRPAVMTMMTGAAIVLANGLTRRPSILRSLQMTDYRVPVEAGRPLALVARLRRLVPGGLTVQVEALADTITTGERTVVAMGEFDIATYPAQTYQEHRS